MSPIAILLAALALVILSAGGVLLVHLQQEDRLTLRLLDVQRRAGVGGAARTVDPVSGLARPVAALGRLIARSGLLSVQTLAELEASLVTAGLRGRAGLSIFVGAKLLLFAGLPMAAAAVMSELTGWPAFWPALIAGAAIVGLLLPDFVIRAKRRTYLTALDAGLPDALDMLVICSEAGLGLEAAFERVGQEVGDGHPVVSIEMNITLQEMRINADRRAALVGMGKRTGLDSLRRLGGTLVQTMQYGTPLSQALRTLSAEMRLEMLTRFEGRAARLPVLLTLPMIIFILPCVFLVVGGPALVQILQNFDR